MADILVTGGAGYIGSSLIPMLLNFGHKVTCFDSLLYRGDVLIPFFRRRGFEFIKGDVRDESAVEAAVQGKDIVIHLAAIVGLPACRENPSLAWAVNLEGTRNIVKALSPSQYLLFGSTGSNYGEVKGLCTEETPLNPLSVYGESKTEAEKVVRAFGQSTAFRFATAFGLSPRLRLDLLVNDLTLQAIRSRYAVVYEAGFRRTFIHVHDMCRAFLFAMENRDKMTGQVYNIGSESMNYSKRDICDIIKAKTGAYFHFAEVGADGDRRDYEVSYQKIRTLRYETTISVEQGVDELIRGLAVIQFSNPYANV